MSINSNSTDQVHCQRSGLGCNGCVFCRIDFDYFGNPIGYTCIKLSFDQVGAKIK